jgi:FtsP/CotA-like multicopper oxidase with cupredoxin domain
MIQLTVDQPRRQCRKKGLEMRKFFIALLFAAGLAAPLTSTAWADEPTKQICERPAAGSIVQPPPDLYSSNGVLNVSLNYVSSLDNENRTLFCFVTPDGLESPTLHANPGETINITLTNKIPKAPNGAVFETMPPVKKRCGAKTMEPDSANMHFHGMNVAPVCHSDEVVHTLVNAGQTFTYSIVIPSDEPAGMYWYHSHVHGLADAAVRGGASGAIEIEGIQNVQPKVANLPIQTLIFRDLILAGQTVGRADRAHVPFWDVSLNYVPIDYPKLTPAILPMQTGQAQFWRVVNAAADTQADLVLKYDGVVQPVQMVAWDGVAIGSQDGTHRGRLVTVNDVFIPVAGRGEFIVPPLPANVKHATLETLHINTGPGGDVDTRRVLADIQPSNQAAAAGGAPAMQMATMPAVSAPPGPQRFEGLDNAKVTAKRHLYFYEIFPDPKDPDDGLFYIVVKGQIPQLFEPDAPPSIVTHQGAVEDWVIENHTNEVHEFHIHQIHFQVREINHVPVSRDERQFRDTYQVPYWTGKGPYPSVTLRMDFRGAVVGDFVYHCHILDHEDAGMMAIIRVKPPNT